MSLRWRLCLVAIIAATLVGGFMPHGVLAGTQSAGTDLVQVAENVVSVPLNCIDATCGKGSPAAPAPAPGIALAAVVGGLVAAAAVSSVIRRRRLQGGVLPAGVRDPLFHPPQFS
jgi:hypothetical protein